MQFFVCSFLYAGSFTSAISTDEITVEKLNGSAYFTGAVLTAIPGYPALPVTEINFLLPDEANLSTVTAYLENGYQETIFPEEWDVEPAPPDICGEEMTPCWHSSLHISDNRDTDVYSMNSYINGKYVDTVTTGKTSGYKFVRVKVLLFDYNPAAKKLKKLENARLTVTFSGGDNEITIPSRLSPNKLQALAKLPEDFINYDEIDFINNNVAFSAIAGNDQNKYYIITTDAIYSSSVQMKRFIASKMARGFEVHLVTEEYSIINNGKKMGLTGWAGEVGLTGYEAAEKIRSYLVSRQNKIDYLLLIGDPHPGECTGQDADGDYLPGYQCNDGGDVPMKWISTTALSSWIDYCQDKPKPHDYYDCVNIDDHASPKRATPSDYYYADLDSNWDHDGDKLIGNDVTVYCHDSSATSAENCTDWKTTKLDGAIKRMSDSSYINRTAEVIVGRIPVYNNNIDDLDSILLKTIKYENTTKEGAQWRKNIFLPMYPSNVSTPNWELGEAIVNNFLPSDFEYYRFYISEIYNDFNYNKIGAYTNIKGNQGTSYREIDGVNDECYYTVDDYGIPNNIRYKSLGNSKYQKYICKEYKTNIDKNRTLRLAYWDKEGGEVTLTSQNIPLIESCSEGEERYTVCYDTAYHYEEQMKLQLQQCDSSGNWNDIENSCKNFNEVKRTYFFCEYNSNKEATFKLYKFNSGEWTGEGSCVTDLDSDIPYMAPFHVSKYYRFDLLEPEEEADIDPLFGSVPTTPSYKNMLDVFNNSKQFGIVTWKTHGRENYSSELIINNDILAKNHGHYINFDNEHPFFTVQVSCLNAKPEYNRNVAYALLLNGAVGTIASTRESGYNSSEFDEKTEKFTNTDLEGNNTGNNASLGYFFTRELTGTRFKEPQDTGHALFNTKADNYSNINNNNRYNLYGDPSLSINTYYDERDRDDDGIRDSFDTCPEIPNPDQADMDGDGVGDVCDNCIKIPNPYEAASFADELINGECVIDHDTDGNCTEEGDGGAYRNKDTHKHGYPVNPDLIYFGPYMWQPDHDLDGEGDACDKDYKYVQTAKEEKNSVTGGGCKWEGKIEFCNVTTTLNDKIGIINNKTGSQKTVTGTVDSRFCWVDDSNLNKWGTEGYCTTNFGSAGLPPIFGGFGYSHGSDPHPMRGIKIESWKKISTSKICDSTGETYSNAEPPQNNNNQETITWDWKEDIKCESLDSYTANITNYQTVTDKKYLNTFFHYTTSAGFRGTELNVSYTIGTEATSPVNPKYFYNKATFARANRSQATPTSIGYGVVGRRFPRGFFWEYLYPYPDYGFDKDMCPNCGPRDRISRDIMNRWKEEPLHEAVSVETIRMEPEGAVMEIGDNLYKFSRGTENYWYMWGNEESRRSDWQLMAVVSAGAAEPYSAAKVGNTTYITEGTGVYYVGIYNILQQASALNSTSAENQATINTARLYYAAELPSVRKPNLININDTLYLLGNGSSVMELYKLSSEKTFEKVSTLNAPAIRDRINYKVINGALYIAGGGNYTNEEYGISPKTDLWQYTEESGFNKITDSLPKEGIFNLFITATADKAILYTKQINDEGKTLKREVDLETGEITTTETAVKGWTNNILYNEGYCIYDTGSRIYPGILKEGSCTKQSDYNYDSHTYFDYKKTVAGWNNHLYLGGLSGIREITIEEDGDLNKEKLHWLGNINNIAVKDNYLYGAGGNKIEILKIESDGSLSGKNALSTKDCDNIRIHGSYLIAGENKKVTIWDISTLENPKKVKTISVDYPVKDIEIGGNYLYIYHDKLFKTGKLALYDISDILNPVKKDEEKKECNDAELTVSGGEVYMGCKNGQYKAVNSNGSLSLKKMSGEKNYMREAYYYNGIIYQVFSGKLHESK